MSITKRFYGKTEEGKDADIYTLSNSNGVVAEITNYGGVLVSLLVPDKNGDVADVVLGYGGIEGYCKKGPYFGAIIGRHANRIENAEFEINGETYHVLKNEGENHLHGGLKGFDRVLWKADVLQQEEGECLRLTYCSVDGEEGYPGNLDVAVTYTLTEDNALTIDYYAVTDKDTVVNLTNHSYFNLSGHAAGDVLRHELMIHADSFTAANKESIPTGEIRKVEGTPLDFTRSTPIGQGINSDYEQIVFANGYDHNWILNVSGKTAEKAAEVYDPDSGRVMEVYTTKPGIQFYSGNFLDGSEVGKEGAVYAQRAGLCLETQYFPNGTQHKHFPSPILRVGQEYKHTTIYKFLNR